MAETPCRRKHILRSVPSAGESNRVNTLADLTTRLNEDTYKEIENTLGDADISFDADNLDDVYDVMLELSSVWDELNDENKGGLLELLAGDGDSRAIESILDNIGDLTGAYEAAENAAGEYLRRCVQKCA